jgi:hypothetical protein
MPDELFVKTSFRRQELGGDFVRTGADAGHAAWWWHGLLIVDPSTRRLGPDMAPGLFVFVRLDNGANFWRHSSQEFHNADRCTHNVQRTACANVDVEIAMGKLANAAQPPKPKPAPPPGDAKA